MKLVMNGNVIDMHVVDKSCCDPMCASMIPTSLAETQPVKELLKDKASLWLMVESPDKLALESGSRKEMLDMFMCKICGGKTFFIAINDEGDDFYICSQCHTTSAEEND